MKSDKDMKNYSFSKQHNQQRKNLTGRGTNDVGGEGDSIILLLGGDDFLLGGGDFLLGGGDSSSWEKGDSGGSERGDWVGDSMIFFLFLSLSSSCFFSATSLSAFSFSIFLFSSAACSFSISRLSSFHFSIIPITKSTGCCTTFR